MRLRDLVPKSRAICSILIGYLQCTKFGYKWFSLAEPFATTPHGGAAVPALRAGLKDTDDNSENHYLENKSRSPP